MPARLLITGAGGFVGRAVVARAAAAGWDITASARGTLTGLPPEVRSCSGLDLSAATDWTDALAGVDAIVHCAARVHVMRDSATDPLQEFRATNTDGTLRLAGQAARAGVRRFVFISSIGVNGAETADRPYFADDPAAPHSAYAVSKHEAELGLLKIASESPMEVVILRPPLVYGPGAPGNFATLVRALRRGMPLPLGAVDNRRSFVALANLVDLIIVCLTHPAAANETFLVSDGEDLSTTELLRRLGVALERPARLLPIPGALLRRIASALGRHGLAQQLLGSLRLDIEKTRSRLGWTPLVTVDQGLAQVAGIRGATLG